ncbi:hypothetical protein L6164_026314 [Bauhinia variegata]|uniref:Uncharacterized protein n=1 Tax=Bauhinia variegata TaxID=167791 RepID=A0ACB9LQK6_BAUVA|nr:hypothetical protein L6164_026314 [Bauhinia variegata]
MPQGETTMTSQDVAIQLGLPIHGRAVTGRTQVYWSCLIQDLLGVTLPDGEKVIHGGRLRMAWLDHHFGVLPLGANDETVRRQAHVYILCLISGTLFLNRGCCSFGHGTASMITSRLVDPQLLDAEMGLAPLARKFAFH